MSDAITPALIESRPRLGPTVRSSRYVSEAGSAPDRSFSEAAASPPGQLRIAVSTKPPRAAAPPLLTDESRAAVEETAELLASLGHAVEWKDPDWGGIGNQIPARYLGGIAEDIDAVPHRDRLEPLTKGYRRVARALAPARKTPYQLLLMTPATSPRSASSRKHSRHSPNLRR